MVAAECGHSCFRPAVDQRILHLIRDDPDTVIGDDTQALGVEVRQREMMNLTLALQIGEMFERVEVALVAIVPPPARLLASSSGPDMEPIL